MDEPTPKPLKTILTFLGNVGVLVLIGIMGYVLYNFLAAYTTVLPAVLRQPGNRAAIVEDRNLAWQSDVSYFYSQLPRLHIAPFVKMSEADYNKAIYDLNQGIPDSSNEEIAAELMRITAMIGDGHTRAMPPTWTTFHFYPLSLYRFQDGYFVVSAKREYADLLGLKLVKIGDMPVEQAEQAVAPYISHDNQSGLWLRAPVYLLSPEFLTFAGIAPKGTTQVLYTFENQAGEAVTATLEPVTDASYNELFKTNPAMQPMFRPERKGEYYWFEKIAETNILYIQYNRCSEDPNLPMKTFAEQVAAQLKGSAVQRVIVDLRYNGGGNSTVINPLLETIASSSKNKKNKLYVLVGRQTFSSAMLNALDFAEKTEAIFVGEAPASSPSHYGEVRSFTLPNTGMVIKYSVKHFVAKGYEGADFTPDLVIEPTYADFGQRSDPVMQHFINPPEE